MLSEVSQITMQIISPDLLQQKQTRHRRSRHFLNWKHGRHHQQTFYNKSKADNINRYFGLAHFRPIFSSIPPERSKNTWLSEILRGYIGLKWVKTHQLTISPEFESQNVENIIKTSCIKKTLENITKQISQPQEW